MFFFSLHFIYFSGLCLISCRRFYFPFYLGVCTNAWICNNAIELNVFVLFLFFFFFCLYSLHVCLYFYTDHFTFTKKKRTNAQTHCFWYTEGKRYIVFCIFQLEGIMSFSTWHFKPETNDGVDDEHIEILEICNIVHNKNLEYTWDTRFCPK